jgi:GH43 family beta-xylosidase
MRTLLRSNSLTFFEERQYGPGHNSFTVSEDGSEDILVYHARTYTEIVGDPLYDPNRHTRAQVFSWKEDSTPNFGKPVPDQKEITSPQKVSL